MENAKLKMISFFIWHFLDNKTSFGFTKYKIVQLIFSIVKNDKKKCLIFFNM